MSIPAEQTDEPYKGLRKDQVNHFSENGYIIVGKLIGDELIESLRIEYDRIFSEARTIGNYRNLSIDDNSNTEEKINAKQQMLQIMQMCERSIHFRMLLYNEQILDITEDLIGPNIQLFHDQALYKPARHGGAVFWHQDNAYWRCLPANLISCWITLDDVDAENGAMHIVPRSHLKLQNHERTKGEGTLLEIGDHISDKDVTIADLPAGGVLFHHCQTLHYTPPNMTIRERRAFVIHFMIPGTRRANSKEPLDVCFSRPMLRMCS